MDESEKTIGLTSPHDWEEFEKTLLWRDAVTFLEGRIMLLYKGLLTSEEPPKLFKLQGRLSELEFILALPTLMIEEIKAVQAEAKAKATALEDTET